MPSIQDNSFCGQRSSKPNVHSNPEIKLLAVKCERLGSWWNIKNLAAPYWRLYWNDAVGASLFLGDDVYALNPSSLYLVPPETPCRTQCLGMLGHFYVHFLATEPYAAVSTPEVFALRPGQEILRLAAKAAAISRDGGGDEGGSLPMLALALVSYALTHIPQSCLARPTGQDRRVVEAMRRIDAAPTAIANSELARLAGMSVNAFGRLFRQCAGITPQVYSRRKRLDQACLLLRFSSLGIKEIAERLDFCDRHHFAKLFKKERGVSPGEYRHGERNTPGSPVAS